MVFISVLDTHAEVFRGLAIVGFGGPKLAWFPHVFQFWIEFREAGRQFVGRRSFSLFSQIWNNRSGGNNLRRSCKWIYSDQIARASSISTTSARMSSTSKVVEHIVFFNVKEGTPIEKANAMVSALQALKSLDTVLQLTVGPALHCSGAFKFTHALHSRYKDKEGLAEYAAHPRHLDVVKECVLPITDDILALDWEADLGGPTLPTYGAIRIAVLKPKDDLAEAQRIELAEILGGYRNFFPSIVQVSFGENFSPARAKGFTWGFLSLFPGIKELEELNANEEHIKLQDEKVQLQTEKHVVFEYVVSPNPANL